jgi:hypothetical protein
MDLLILLALAAVSQPPALDFPKEVKPGAKVFVIDWTGAECAGTIVDVVPGGVTITQREGERVAIPAQSIARVERTDSLWNGLFIGAGVGAVLSGVWDVRNSGWELRALQWGFYTGIGVFLDWLREGRTVVYRAERQPMVTVAPLVAPCAAGLALRVSF